MQSFNPVARGSVTTSSFSTQEITQEDFSYFQWFLGVLNRRWWLMLGIGLLVSSYQIKSDLTKPPVYQSQFQLLVQPPEADITNPLERAGEVFANSGNQGDYFATQITILLSNRLLNPVIQAIYQAYPNLNESNFSLQDLANRINIQQINKGQVLEINYQDSDPKRVKFVLDKLAKSYLNYTLTDQQIRSRQKLSFVSKQIPILEARVNKLQNELLRLQQSYNFFDASSQGTNLNQSLNDILQKKRDVELQIQQNQTLVAMYNGQLGSAESEAIALDALSQSEQYKALVNRLNEINMQLAKESTRLTKDNPLIQQLQQEKENLLPLLNQQSKGVLNTLPNTIPKISPKVVAPNAIRSDLVDKLLEAKNQLAVLKQQQQILFIYETRTRQELKKFSQVFTQFTNLQRQLTLATESLNRLLAVEQTLEVETTKRFIPWRLVADPVQPTKPIDRTLQNFIFAILKGMIAGGMAGALIEFLDRRYHSPDEIRRDCNITVLGVIPYSKELHGLNKISGKKVSVHFLESFSVLFSSVFFLRQKQRCRSFIVTSATSKDGKSTTSLFTALAASKLGQKVLLIDGDRYFPQGKNWLNLLARVEYSSKDKNGHTLPQPSEITSTDKPINLLPNLDYFKTDNNALDPDQLLSAQSLLVLLNKWQEVYDVILIDTPPVLGLSDSRLIASQTDGVLLVVRLDKTIKDTVYKTLESLKLADLNVLGIVANGVKRSHGGYGYGYGYGYYNSYNRYYQKKLEGGLTKVEET